MSQHVYSGLIEQFCLSIGLRDARPDNEGYCAMTFDEIVVHLQYTADDDTLTMFSRLGNANESRAQAIYTMLLAANMFWQGAKGCTFSAEPDSRTVFIAIRSPLAKLNTATFHNWIGDFVDTAEQWTAHLAKANEGDMTRPAAPGATNDSFDPSFMTRV